MRADVFLVKTEPRYPEFPYTEQSALQESLRALWSAWGKDPDNPFADWVRPGGRVVIKPNWVRDANPKGHDLDSLVTHSSIIRLAIDWAAAAMEGRGSIIIGDSPLQSCNFAALMAASRMREVLEQARARYPGLEIAAEDWRLTLFDRSPGLARWAAGPQSHRPDRAALMAQGYEIVDLGRGSFLEDIAEYAERFRVTCYQPSLMAEHHRPGKHEYLVTRRIFEADLVLNLPKMKTHIKSGVTAALKNLVGINGHKEYLPHHIRGSYWEGGDCYCETNRFCQLYEQIYDRFWEEQREMSPAKRSFLSGLMRALWSAARFTGGDTISAGSWSGNETIWRTTIDLNHILHCSPRSAKHIVSLVDGVIAGDGEGPLEPDPKPAGLLIAGENPAYVDATVAKLMGYNVSRIPTVHHAIYDRRSRFAGPDLDRFAVTAMLHGSEPELLPFHCLPNLRFAKPKHWMRAEAASSI